MAHHRVSFLHRNLDPFEVTDRSRSALPTVLRFVARQTGAIQGVFEDAVRQDTEWHPTGYTDRVR